MRAADPRNRHGTFSDLLQPHAGLYQGIRENSCRPIRISVTFGSAAGVTPVARRTAVPARAVL